MTSLPFSDHEVSVYYQQQAENMFKETLSSLEMVEVHPDVLKLLHKSDVYNETNSRKRGSRDTDVDIGYQKSKQAKNTTTQGIDDSRYSLEGSIHDMDKYEIILSYLRHQELTLDELMSRTILNQWAINNDYVSNGLEMVDMKIEKQIKEIEQINKYREQSQNKFANAEKMMTTDWHDSLRNNLK
ncbi:hypothetical protein Kpol_1025p20 [Vanderwaltozyma polyspora DSM 70294]|uniref:Pre-mRNA-splicing factor SPF27 n=1 Tax=Vanderwaltozyma polyspora (strain ATCC 22028 / DSM 70294 / BCRC 21397 / CBS 2163 / NBRC 10782 / NRRL Y-8283 / UCD 57-17) TaxID=436907 RepID=A7TKU5_VANPO|nr:uncharacterized protein Kpol_1025p20 [Vanderwaltozyma polyspora DSM 70294]EDO17100.1 hypothetical protein Kpol_1025p20 [Vanderwaltozyma polyspora DSM 70294]